VGQEPRRVGILLIAAVSSALGLFSTFEAYNYVAIFMSEEPSFLMLLALNMTYWWSWAVLVPGILWMARRFRFARTTWRRSLGAHAVGVVAFTAAHTLLTVSCRVLILHSMGRDADWRPELQRLFFLNFDWEMMTYWALVGLSHALDLHRESQERTLAAAQLETKLAEAQLQALQRQLHPHFLFNTLHAISALMHRDPDAADAMLARLSELLRLTLDRVAVQQVTLRDDLEFIEKYLEIERTRFGDRLQIRMAIDPETLDAAVPSLVLQPIIENAIRYGVAPRIGGGQVEITATRQGERLVLLVRDDGPGLSRAKREALTTGVGIANTRSRLEHLYRDQYRFDFDEAPGGGLIVTIAVPFVSASEVSRTLEGVA
jgi:two-component system, LytTR family, sensor kinase